MLLLGAILHKGTTLGQQQLKHGQQILHHAKLSIQLDPKVSIGGNCLFLLKKSNLHDHYVVQMASRPTKQYFSPNCASIVSGPKISCVRLSILHSWLMDYTQTMM